MRTLKLMAVMALLLAGCSGEEVVTEEGPTPSDAYQVADIDAIEERVDKMEARQAVLEKHMLGQPEPKQEKTGSEILLEETEKRDLERRVEALEVHQ